MEIETVDRFSPALDEVALASPEATFYHTGFWIERLSRVFPSLRFRCLVAVEGSRVIGYLPYFESKKGPFTALWSLPFGTYGGPVARGDERTRGALADALARLRGKKGIHEVGIVDYTNGVRAAGFRAEDGSTHVIDLSAGFERLWEDVFEKSKRRQTRRAAKEGLAVSETRSERDIDAYYAIYRARIDAWGEKFRYPKALFDELAGGGEGRVRLFVARRGDDLLGGHLNFYFRDTVIAWNGVVRDTADGTQASTLLYAECIRHACESGLREYNLGSSLGKRSLIDYKESLGGAPRGYRTLRWRSPAGEIAGVLRRIVSRR
jgi:CelD/BcsL family acetyltransferase involved in cellulose biosynthesis